VSDVAGTVTGFICESFAFKVPAPGFALAAIKGLSHIAPRLPVLKLKNEDFSRDPKAVEALNNDPLTAHEVQPAITVAVLVRADERLREEFPHISRLRRELLESADAAGRHHLEIWPRS
jgi:acylglycerol lipase